MSRAVCNLSSDTISNHLQFERGVEEQQQQQQQQRQQQPLLSCYLLPLLIFNMILLLGNPLVSAVDPSNLLSTVSWT